MNTESESNIISLLERIRNVSEALLIIQYEARRSMDVEKFSGPNHFKSEQWKSGNKMVETLMNEIVRRDGKKP